MRAAYAPSAPELRRGSFGFRQRAAFIGATKENVA